MQFNAASYGRAVEQILECGAPSLAGLVASAPPSPELTRAISESLFVDSAHPTGALAGLWMYFDCFDESHQISQADGSCEGSLWHGIAHRREPDYSNSAYWFREAGSHPVFPQILEAARVVPGPGLRLGETWDPFAFIDFCEEAVKVGGGREAWALAVQRLEWQILFDFCARKSSV